jgi:hypothetical protein
LKHRWPTLLDAPRKWADYPLISHFSTPEPTLSALSSNVKEISRKGFAEQGLARGH